MTKNKISLLTLCLALLVNVAGCGKSTNSATTEVAKTSTSAVSNSNSTETKSGTNPLSSPTSTQTPGNSPKTVQLRLTEVETNADMIDSPLADFKIIIKAGETSLNKLTNDDGVVVFDSVPCGNEIVITAKNEEGSEDGVFHRKLECAGTQVDLGVIERAFGGKYTLEQRKPQFMGYDAIKEVWRTADGKIVPNEKIRQIMEKRQ